MLVSYERKQVFDMLPVSISGRQACDENHVLHHFSV